MPDRTRSADRTTSAGVMVRLSCAVSHAVQLTKSCTDVFYEFYIDNDGDAVEDLTFQLYYGNRLGGTLATVPVEPDGAYHGEAKDRAPC